MGLDVLTAIADPDFVAPKFNEALIMEKSIGREEPIDFRAGPTQEIHDPKPFAGQHQTGMDPRHAFIGEANVAAGPAAQQRDAVFDGPGGLFFTGDFSVHKLKPHRRQIGLLAHDQRVGTVRSGSRGRFAWGNLFEASTSRKEYSPAEIVMPGRRQPARRFWPS